MSSPRRLAAGLALAALTSLASPLPALAATAGTPPGAAALPCADPVVADPVGGAAAVRELGADLPAAAAKIDRSPAEYRALLRSDSTLRVDKCGATFVVEPAMTAGEQVAAAADAAPVSALGALDPGGDAFALNSRPGSHRTIYLDFDGQDVSGTQWNTDTGIPDAPAAPYDSDGSPATFSLAERNVIRGVWLRVAEDYAPFDVNVTTHDPGQPAITRSSVGDADYGTRALITNDSVLFSAPMGCNSGCGGVAYLNAFDNFTRHDQLQPALIFQRGLGGAGATAKSLAEAAAHEVGHNFGLSHDGTAAVGYYEGQGTWAPIMGVGYYRPVTQWSRGEYTGANNQEDDLTIIAANGVSALTDDHANNRTGATALTYGGPAADGLIGSRTDTDWFRFTVPSGAGTTTVHVSPQTVSADLDTSLTVFNASNAQIATVVDPAVSSTGGDQVTGLDATFAEPLVPGTYTAVVDGVGSGNPETTGYSDYASLGRYTISVGGPVGPVVPVTPLTMSVPAVPNGTVGANYAITVSASGSTDPYTWSIAAGSLPAGLSLDAHGQVTGVPTAAGSSTATVQVAAVDGQSSTVALTITISAAPVPPPPTTPPPTTPPPATPPPAAPLPPATLPPTAPPPTQAPALPTVWTGTLRAAVSTLTVRSETPTGFAATRFPLVDADHDCRSTRTEVLAAESRRTVHWTTRRDCTVRSGRWFSLFDRHTVTAPAKVATVPTVPLAEAWQSGGRAWPAARRRAYANDLADPRTLIAVTRHSAKARADREPTRWLPASTSRCTYVASWVAVKLRWGLAVDHAEQTRLAALAKGCGSARLTVRRV